MTGCQIESRTRENMWRYVYPMKKGFKFYICRRNTFVCKCLKLSNEKWSHLVTLPMWTLKDMLKLLTPSGTLSAVWIHLLTIQRVLSDDEVAEWLRRWTANPLGSARVGSNPILVEVFLENDHTLWLFCFYVEVKHKHDFVLKLLAWDYYF